MSDSEQEVEQTQQKQSKKQVKLKKNGQPDMRSLKSQLNAKKARDTRLIKDKLIKQNTLAVIDSDSSDDEPLPRKPKRRQIESDSSDDEMGYSELVMRNPKSDKKIKKLEKKLQQMEVLLTKSKCKPTKKKVVVVSNPVPTKKEPSPELTAEKQKIINQTKKIQSQRFLF